MIFKQTGERVKIIGSIAFSNGAYHEFESLETGKSLGWHPLSEAAFDETSADDVKIELKALTIDSIALIKKYSTIRKTDVEE